MTIDIVVTASSVLMDGQADDARQEGLLTRRME